MDAFQAARFCARAQSFVKQPMPDVRSVDESRVAELSNKCEILETKTAQLEHQLSELIHTISTNLPQVFERDVTIGIIIKTVANYYKCTKNDLIGARKTFPLVLYRQMAIYLSRIMTTRSMPQIGRQFGNRDHTTVIHAVRRITDTRLKNADLCFELYELERNIAILSSGQITANISTEVKNGSHEGS